MYKTAITETYKQHSELIYNIINRKTNVNTNVNYNNATHKTHQQHKHTYINITVPYTQIHINATLFQGFSDSTRPQSSP